MRWTHLATLAIVALLLLRVATIFHDGPWGIVTRGFGFDSDEGFYTKSAQILVRDGRWAAPLDFAAHTHNPLHTLLLALVFSIAGPGLAAARGVSVAASVVTIVLSTPSAGPPSRARSRSSGRSPSRARSLT